MIESSPVIGTDVLIVDGGRSPQRKREYYYSPHGQKDENCSTGRRRSRGKR